MPREWSEMMTLGPCNMAYGQDMTRQYVSISISAPGIRRQQWELCHWHRPGIVVSSMYPSSSLSSIGPKSMNVSSLFPWRAAYLQLCMDFWSSRILLWDWLLVSIYERITEGIWSDSYHCTTISLISDMTLLRINKTHRLICHSQMYFPRRWCLTFKHAVLSNASDSCAVAVKIEGFRPGTLEQKQNERRRKLGNHQTFFVWYKDKNNELLKYNGCTMYRFDI